jgi:hypothetical protein
MAAALATTVLAGPGSGAAHADRHPDGTLCGLATVMSPDTPRSMFGVLYGGPLVSLDATVGTTYCSVQINSPTHASGGVVAAASSGGNAASFAVSTTQYFREDSDNIYVCTNVSYNSVTYYWSDSDSPLTPGTWSTNPNVPCVDATSVYEPIRTDVVVPYTTR